MNISQNSRNYYSVISPWSRRQDVEKDSYNVLFVGKIQSSSSKPVKVEKRLIWMPEELLQDFKNWAWDAL